LLVEPVIGGPVIGGPVGAEEFAALLDPLGPFEPMPVLAIGVSGGGDSMALALLAAGWAAARGGRVIALVVDHGLRPESAAEAADTVVQLSACGIPARVLALSGLAHGSALAERARAARHRALREACAEAGILHLLLGHHARDQVETLMIRALASSGTAGLAGMPALAESGSVRILRPLLALDPERLRSTLTHQGVRWLEDPSNRDPRAQRSRLRAGLAADASLGTAALIAAARNAGLARARRDVAIAAALARQVAFDAAGFALLSPGPIEPAALAAVLRTIAGAAHSPAAAAVAELARRPRPSTLGGVRLLPAGRLGPGLLAVREAAAMAPPLPAEPGACWDGRFRLATSRRPPAGATLGAVGADSRLVRRASNLPSIVLQTLPALRVGGALHAVPHIGWPDPAVCASTTLLFAPPVPAAPAPFVPA
jgi:tRNA(Ile)-lysidine synthase